MAPPLARSVVSGSPGSQYCVVSGTPRAVVAHMNRVTPAIASSAWSDTCPLVSHARLHGTLPYKIQTVVETARQLRSTPLSLFFALSRGIRIEFY